MSMPCTEIQKNPHRWERRNLVPAPSNPPRRNRNHSLAFRHRPALCLDPSQEGLVSVSDWAVPALRTRTFIPRLTTFYPTSWYPEEVSKSNPVPSTHLVVPTLMSITTKRSEEKEGPRSTRFSTMDLQMAQPEHTTPPVGTETNAQARYPFAPGTKSTRDSTKTEDGTQPPSKASRFPLALEKIYSLSALTMAKQRRIFLVLISVPCRISVASKHAKLIIGRSWLGGTPTRDWKDRKGTQ